MISPETETKDEALKFENKELRAQIMLIMEHLKTLESRFTQMETSFTSQIRDLK